MAKTEAAILELAAMYEGYSIPNRWILTNLHRHTCGRPGGWPGGRAGGRVAPGGWAFGRVGIGRDMSGSVRRQHAHDHFLSTSSAVLCYVGAKPVQRRRTLHAPKCSQVFINPSSARAMRAMCGRGQADCCGWLSPLRSLSMRRQIDKVHKIPGCLVQADHIGGRMTQLRPWRVLPTGP